MNQAGTLILVCRKCTRESVIPAPTMETAVELAKLRGWVADGEVYICPTCPAIRYSASGMGMVLGNAAFLRAVEGGSASFSASREFSS